MDLPCAWWWDPHVPHPRFGPLVLLDHGEGMGKLEPSAALSAPQCSTQDSGRVPLASPISHWSSTIPMSRWTFRHDKRSATSSGFPQIRGSIDFHCFHSQTNSLIFYFSQFQDPTLKCAEWRYSVSFLDLLLFQWFSPILADLFLPCCGKFPYVLTCVSVLLHDPYSKFWFARKSSHTSLFSSFSKKEWLLQTQGAYFKTTNLL